MCTCPVGRGTNLYSQYKSTPSRDYNAQLKIEENEWTSKKNVNVHSAWRIIIGKR